jgi:glycosyltransferase involved in cell wall biosynthesis
VSYGTPLPKEQTYKKQYLDEVGSRLDMSRIHFLGQVPYQTLLRIYQISSAHVYLTYPFVLSWSVLEAMAAGCTVIASRTPPVEEVVTDGKNGILVDFFSPEEIATRVDEVFGRSRDTARMRERARKTVVEGFDLRRVCLPRHLKLLGINSTKHK